MIARVVKAGPRSAQLLRRRKANPNLNLNVNATSNVKTNFNGTFKRQRKHQLSTSTEKSNSTSNSTPTQSSTSAPSSTAEPAAKPTVKSVAKSTAKFNSTSTLTPTSNPTSYYAVPSVHLVLIGVVNVKRVFPFQHPYPLPRQIVLLQRFHIERLREAKIEHFDPSVLHLLCSHWPAVNGKEKDRTVGQGQKGKIIIYKPLLRAKRVAKYVQGCPQHRRPAPFFFLFT